MERDLDQPNLEMHGQGTFFDPRLDNAQQFPIAARNRFGHLPGWNLHKAEEIGIDSFQADRAPDHAYKTQNLPGLFIRERGLFMNSANKGRFFHDGRFATLLDVVNPLQHPLQSAADR